MLRSRRVHCPPIDITLSWRSRGHCLTFLVPTQTTNVDNTVTAKPTPAPVRPSANVRPPLALVPATNPNTINTARPARTPARVFRQAHAGAPTAKNSPAVSKKPATSPYAAPEYSSPLVYPPPKTPAVRAPAATTTTPAAHSRRPAPGDTAMFKAAPRTGFRRLATDCSDEIVEFSQRSLHVSPIASPPESYATSHAPPEKEREKTGLGKRNSREDHGSPSTSQNGARQPKRLVRFTHIRTQECSEQNNFHHG